MNQLLFLLTISLLSAQLIDITPEALCQCQQITSQADCQILTDCQWVDMECNILSKTQPQPITYCSQFDAKSCPYQYSCAYYQDSCTHFSGCFAYQSDNDQICQSISNRCFKSDGTRCIELGQCNTYLIESTCIRKKISDSNNFNCFWNGTSCEDADSCSKLPRTYLLDVECRHQISSCTVKLDGGCQVSGKECSDNLMEIQCYWNQQKSQMCIWDSVAQQCKDKICENAPNYILTDEKCQEYLSTCTTKLGGGCQKRTSCMAAQMEEACRVDYGGNQCYWTGSSCVDRICSNAPLELNTNSKCEEYLKGCLVMVGGGCVQNLGCLSAKLEIACLKNPEGGDCVWNAGYCLDKICSNAPVSINTHEKCTQFRQNCTVNLDKNGCVERKCENAQLNTQDCEAYLSGCIVNSKGGCMQLSNCESINWKLACLVDSQGRKCFWDSNSNLCKLKKCENIPTVIVYTESYCRQFDESCSAVQSSCVVRTCENSLEQYCALDGSNNKCIWRNKCFMKTCSRASKVLNSHMGCQEYLNTCTVNFRKSGCMEIPILCSGLQIRENCEINRNGGICGWNGVSCEDKNCGTADKGIQSSSECNNYLRGCVVKNDLQGCMELPDNCGDSIHYDNCIQTDCIWYQKQCVKKSCINSPDTNCTTYLNNHQCIVNATQDGCINKPIDCTNLLQHQCIDSATQNGDCYWLYNKCVNKLCQNLFNPLQIYTHSICSTLYSICTVNINNDGCQNNLELCESYQTEEQCQITTKQIKCVWDNLKCRNANCQDAPNTIDYNTHTKCQSYMNTCTVAHGLANNQCIQKSTTCWGNSQSQCQKTYDQSICYWNQNICQPITPDTNCSNIKLDTPYTHTLCENIMKKCTINSTNDGCFNKSCSNIPSGVQNDLSCSNWSTQCTANRNLDACLIRRSLCQHYSQAECYKADQGLCFWDSLNCQAITTDIPCELYALVEISPANCALYNSKCTANQTNCIAKTCANFIATPTYQNCQNWLPNCTVNRDHTQCLDFEPLCSHYAVDDCFRGEQMFCTFDGLTCVPVGTCESLTLSNWSDETCKTLNPDCRITDQPQCEEKTCTNYLGTKFSYELCDQHKTGCVMNIANNGCEDKNCENYPGPIYNHSNCTGWLNTCTSNSERSSCISSKADCVAYQEAECYHSLNDGFCKFQTAQCLVQSTVCGDILLKQYSHSSCQEINSSCTVLRDGKGCYSMITGICTSLTENQCYKVSGSQSCTWDGSGCINLDLTGNCSSILKPALGEWNEEICSELNSKCTYSSVSLQCENKSCSNFKGLSVSHDQCNSWNNLCTNSLVGCVAISCSNYPGSTFNHSNCNGWLNSCTRNRSGTQCVSIMNCNQYSKVNCFRSSTKFCHYKNSACVDVVSGECSTLSPGEFSDQFCNELDATCSVNRALTQCITMVNKCSDYLTKTDCYRSLEGHCNWIVIGNSNLCQKIDNSILCSQLSLSTYNHGTCNNQKSTCTFNSQNNRCTDMSCENYQGNVFTHELCYSWMNSCTVNRAQTKCITIPSNCISSNLDNCFRSGINGNTLCTYNYTTSQCQEVNSQSCSQLSVGSSKDICQILKSSCIQNESTSKCITKTCDNYSGNVYTHEKCQEWMDTCTPDRLRTKCIVMGNSCNGYSANDCYNSLGGKCNLQNNTTCMLIQSFTLCTELVLTTYTDENCADLHPSCIANGITSCQSKSCQTKLTEPFTFQSCQEYLLTCSVNSTGTACIDIRSTCALYDQPTNCVRSKKSYCNWYNGICVDKECEQNTSSTTNQDCEIFMPTCTISRIGHCTPLLNNCSDYIYQQECNSTLNQIKCIWMQDQSKCVDKTCDSLPKILTNHEDCFLQLSGCTVAPNGYGCVQMTKCETYSSEIQCKINVYDNICIWNTNVNPPLCQDKSCQTAPQNEFYQTHAQCQQYLSTCTLSETGSGCTQIKDCLAYTNEKQCYITVAQLECAWSNNSCKRKGCDTAPNSYTTFAQCQSYQLDCTAALQGCRIIPSTCDQMFNEDQCRFTLQNIQCYWNSINSMCVERTCDNAPITSTNEVSCNSHMKGCTILEAKCAPMVCEDYMYQTDQECLKAGNEINSPCTTNGIQCVPRGTCLQAITQNACTTDMDGNQCGWYGKYCSMISCETASSNLVTDAQCNEYLKDCVPKLGGGCTSRKQCEDATIEEACTQEKSGQSCLWIAGKCSVKLCSIFLAGSHQECQNLNMKCTYNGLGRCQNIDTCVNYSHQESCILGLEGPCLWIQGQCYFYENCQSLPWKTDSECKQISPLCTSDGNSCVPLTNCSDTNIVAGCINGIDGECLRSVTSLGSTSDPVCSVFKQCTDAYYLTHKECQLAHKSCTTNTTTNCIALLNCSKYSLAEQCVIDLDGITYNENQQKTSTGICVWDQTLFPAGCRNQICDDLKGETDSLCNSQLSGCTTNGFTCIVRQNCVAYSNSRVCGIAMGIDGQCFWHEPKSVGVGRCALKQCNDILYGQYNDICTTQGNCVSDGVNCVDRAKCTQYLTQSACLNTGYDGTCVWRESTCVLMDSCDSAKNNKIACQYMRTYCYWDGNDYQGNCVKHNCATYYEHNMVCSYFPKFGTSQYTVCSFNKNLICVETEPQQLSSSDCLTSSGHTFVWDVVKSTCSACLVVQKITPNIEVSIAGYILLLSITIMSWI